MGESHFGVNYGRHILKTLMNQLRQRWGGICPDLTFNYQHTPRRPATKHTCCSTPTSVRTSRLRRNCNNSCIPIKSGRFNVSPNRYICRSGCGH